MSWLEIGLSIVVLIQSLALYGKHRRFEELLRLAKDVDEKMAIIRSFEGKL